MTTVRAWARVTAAPAAGAPRSSPIAGEGQPRKVKGRPAAAPATMPANSSTSARVERRL